MKNLKVLQFLFFLFFTTIVSGQTLTKEIIEDGNRRRSYPNRYTLDRQIKYIEIDETLIRIEKGFIQILDENLKVVDKLQLPEPNEDCHYSIDKKDHYLYITQTEQITTTEIKSITLYQIDLFNVENFNTFTDYPDTQFNDSKISFIGEKLFYQFSNQKEIITFYMLDKNLSSYTEGNFDEYKTKYVRFGELSSIYEKNDTIIAHYSFFKSPTFGGYYLHFDKDLNYLFNVFESYNYEESEQTFVDRDGNVRVEKNSTVTEKEFDPFIVKHNGEDIWIKNTWNHSKTPSEQIETWISTNGINYEINLNEHFKKKMNEIGMNKSTSANTPVIYADPANESIVIQYQTTFSSNGSLTYLYYFILDNNLNIRNIYKTSLQLYPIDHTGFSFFQMNRVQESISFSIKVKPFHWDGDSKKGVDNAFDFAFTKKKKLKDLFSIINIKNTQYLFIDRLDGSTTGYIFKN